ncbi:MAG TPA: hypothetical protein VMO20_03505 [Candidatus Acidoferrum sp.]|nr:hypothetical protein [Candidatus Acidoferrum sp.]
MVAALKHPQWICAVLVCISAHAKDISSYKIGDTAQADITASVPFDVPNIQATAALKATKAMYVPVIFREQTHITNAMVKEFLTAFAKAHSTFTNGIDTTFQTNVTDAVIASPDFGYFVTEFNVVNKKFPVTPELAAAWARGDSGAALRDKWLGQLVQTMNRPVRPDTLPPGLVLRKTIRLVQVKSLEADLTLDVARHGHGVPVTNVVMISSLRDTFRSEFPQDEQPLARALAEFLRPNCAPDADLTQQAREYTIRPLVVADHYEPGQAIVRQGQAIDAQTKAALDAFNEKLVPAALNQQIAAAHQDAQQEQQQAQSERAAAQLAQQQQLQAQRDREAAQRQAQQEQQQAAAMQEQALAAQTLALKMHTRNEWLMTVLGAISVLVVLVLWRLISQRRTIPISVPARLERMEKAPVGLSPELAPYLAQTLKDAVVQGLAAQRAELLEVQRMAAQEIAELVDRLDQLQAPMQERLRAYQDRIEELQRELAQRTEENRELLKMKIEMMRRQLETERSRVKFN